MTAPKDARVNLLGAINRLRYSGTGIPTPTSLIEMDEVEFLDTITRWITEFNRVLGNVADTTTEMAKELTELRSQRKAVRDFLGIGISAGQGGIL